MMSVRMFSLLCCLLGVGLGASRCLRTRGKYRQDLRAIQGTEAEDDDHHEQMMAVAALLSFAKDPIWTQGECGRDTTEGSGRICGIHGGLPVGDNGAGGGDGDENFSESADGSARTGESCSHTTASSGSVSYSTSEDDFNSGDDYNAPESTAELVNSLWKPGSLTFKIVWASGRRAPAKNIPKRTLCHFHRFPRFSTVAELVEGWEASEAVKAILIEEYGGPSRVTGRQATELSYGYYKYAPIGKQIAILGKEGVLGKYGEKALEEAIGEARAEALEVKKARARSRIAAAPPKTLNEENPRTTRSRAATAPIEALAKTMGRTRSRTAIAQAEALKGGDIRKTRGKIATAPAEAPRGEDIRRTHGKIATAPTETLKGEKIETARSKVVTAPTEALRGGNIETARSKIATAPAKFLDETRAEALKREKSEDMRSRSVAILAEAHDDERAGALRRERNGGTHGRIAIAPIEVHEIIEFPQITRIEDFPDRWPEWVLINKSIPRPICNKKQRDEIKNRYTRLKPLALMLDHLGRDKFLNTYLGMNPYTAVRKALKTMRNEGYKHKGAWTMRRPE